MPTNLTEAVAQLSTEQRRNMNWLISLVRSTSEGNNYSPEVFKTLQRSLHVYSAYVTTGDNRYLSLCESYLQACLTTP